MGATVEAFLATLDNPGTARNYAGTLRALVAGLGADTPVAALGEPSAAAEIDRWFEERWGQRAAAALNRNLDALRSATRYWADQGWLDADLTRGLRRRRRPPDRTRALSRVEVERLLSRQDVALREKTLWRLLYETAARIGEVLSLDVDDLNLRTHQARVRRKGGAADVIVWQTGTARLLPRLLQGRTTGPVFLTERRARWSCLRSTWTPSVTGPVFPTGGRPRCSSRPPVASPFTNCVTRRSPMQPRTGPTSRPC